MSAWSTLSKLTMIVFHSSLWNDSVNTTVWPSVSNKSPILWGRKLHLTEWHKIERTEKPIQWLYYIFVCRSETEKGCTHWLWHDIWGFNNSEYSGTMYWQQNTWYHITEPCNSWEFRSSETWHWVWFPMFQKNGKSSSLRGVLHSFKMSGTRYPATWHHIPWDLQHD